MMVNIQSEPTKIVVQWKYHAIFGGAQAVGKVPGVGHAQMGIFNNQEKSWNLPKTGHGLDCLQDNLSILDYLIYRKPSPKWPNKSLWMVQKSSVGLRQCHGCYFRITTLAIKQKEGWGIQKHIPGLSTQVPIRMGKSISNYGKWEHVPIYHGYFFWPRWFKDSLDRPNIC